MKTVTKKGRVRSAFGKPLSQLLNKKGEKLPKSIAFTAKYDIYETFAELSAAKAELSNDDQVKARNNQLKSKAKAAAQKAKIEELEIVEPSMENDGLLRLKTIYNGIKAAGGMTDEDARATAETLAKAKWSDYAEAEEDDDEEDDEE